MSTNPAREGFGFMASMSGSALWWHDLGIFGCELSCVVVLRTDTLAGTDPAKKD